MEQNERGQRNSCPQNLIRNQEAKKEDTNSLTDFQDNLRSTAFQKFRSWIPGFQISLSPTSLSAALLEKNFAGATACMPVAGEIDFGRSAACDQTLYFFNHVEACFGNLLLQEPLPDYAALQRGGS